LLQPLEGGCQGGSVDTLSGAGPKRFLHVGKDPSCTSAQFVNVKEELAILGSLHAVEGGRYKLTPSDDMMIDLISSRRLSAGGAGGA